MKITAPTARKALPTHGFSRFSFWPMPQPEPFIAPSTESAPNGTNTSPPVTSNGHRLPGGTWVIGRVTDEVVHVRMALSSPRSGASDVIVEDVQAELFDHLHGGREVRVEVVSNPPWTTARMAVVPLRRRAA